MNSYHDDKEDLLRRLKKIEGQIKGIQRMIEKDTYCVDVLIQVAAVRSAINSVGKILLKGHTLGCVKNAINTERQDDMIDELVETFMKFMK